MAIAAEQDFVEWFEALVRQVPELSGCEASPPRRPYQHRGLFAVKRAGFYQPSRIRFSPIA
jgi:hypothetical protein